MDDEITECAPDSSTWQGACAMPLSTEATKTATAAMTSQSQPVIVSTSGVLPKTSQSQTASTSGVIPKISQSQPVTVSTSRVVPKTSQSQPVTVSTSGAIPKTSQSQPVTVSTSGAIPKTSQSQPVSTSGAIPKTSQSQPVSTSGAIPKTSQSQPVSTSGAIPKTSQSQPVSTSGAIPKTSQSQPVTVSTSRVIPRTSQSQPVSTSGAIPKTSQSQPVSTSGAIPKTSQSHSHSQPVKASGAISKSKPSGHGTMQLCSLSRPSIKDQSQGAQAQNRNNRSAVRPFFCCGSELSLVSLKESVELNGPGHCNSSRSKAVVHDTKLSLSDWEDNCSGDWLPHSYSCTSDFGAVCGSGASIQTVCGTGKASGGSLVRRVNSDKRKTKKHFWSLRFRKKLPSVVKPTEMGKSACTECGSIKCYSSQGARCDMMCEKGQGCGCQKRSFRSAAAAEMGRQPGRVADRRASVAALFPISGNEELLLGERLLERPGSHSRNRASCNVESLMHHVDETPLSHLTSRLQRFNLGTSLAEYATRDPFEEYSPLIEFQTDFVAEDMVDSLIHTRIDFIHHLVPDLSKITSCSFYWGVIDRYEAERLLDKKREGTFLLRDSAQDDFLFSVSFRRYNRSLHARIEQWNHRFSFDVHDPAVYSSDSVCGLIEHYKDSSRCLFFEPMLTEPLHRTFPFSLQHLARAVVCNSLSRYDHIGKLPLPMSMKTYLRYYHYKQKVCVRSFEEPSG